MVNINLLGDDKGGIKEDRTEEMSSNPTFNSPEFPMGEEKGAGTFNGTQEYDYSFKSKSYTSRFSTLIIVGGIVVLSVLAYFLLFRKGTPPSEEEALMPEGTEELAETLPSEEESTIPPTSTETPGATEMGAENIDPVLEGIIVSARSAIGAVTETVSAVPSNVRLTLLSQVGPKLTLEALARSNDAANQLLNDLRQSPSIGTFEVVSKNQVTENGQAWVKILMMSTLPGNQVSGLNSQVESLQVEELKNWLSTTAIQSGARVRGIQAHPAQLSGNYRKVPILARLYGDRTSLLGFLEELAGHAFNLELTKILFVSPETRRTGNEEFSLVLYLYLYEEA